jgi:hypothetical protein
LYIINYYLKLCLLTPLILSTTLALAALDNPLINKLPLFINAMAPFINTLYIQLTETKAITNYSKDLTTLVKIYIEESKYSKEDNNFNYKLIIFNNFYNRVDIL